jgi:hypothetical protein
LVACIDGTGGVLVQVAQGALSIAVYPY